MPSQEFDEFIEIDRDYAFHVMKSFKSWGFSVLLYLACDLPNPLQVNLETAAKGNGVTPVTFKKYIKALHTGGFIKQLGPVKNGTVLIEILNPHFFRTTKLTKNRNRKKTSSLLGLPDF